MIDRRVSESSRLEVRPATEADLEDVAEMIEQYVQGHAAERHPRPPATLREAFFGTHPAAQLLVASSRGRIVGLAQWTRIYDLFWASFGGDVNWLYVRPEARGLGIPAAIVAGICQQVRLSGGELVRGNAQEASHSALYERADRAWPTREGYLSGEAFQLFADLAGLAPREIAKRLPRA
jgi:GNAT superfamily N-acetyltransferase